jgi:hypothetical protein
MIGVDQDDRVGIFSGVIGDFANVQEGVQVHGISLSS